MNTCHVMYHDMHNRYTLLLSYTFLMSQKSIALVTLATSSHGYLRRWTTLWRNSPTRWNSWNSGRLLSMLSWKQTLPLQRSKAEMGYGSLATRWRMLSKSISQVWRKWVWTILVCLPIVNFSTFYCVFVSILHNIWKLHQGEMCVQQYCATLLPFNN